MNRIEHYHDWLRDATQWKSKPNLCLNPWLVV